MPPDTPHAERPFAEPWQASAFALTVALNERGLLPWSEWADTLGAVLRERGEEASGDEGYWSAWVEALERVLAARGLAPREAVAERARAWERAAEATPHGTPITLDNDPQRRRAG